MPTEPQVLAPPQPAMPHPATQQVTHGPHGATPVVYVTRPMEPQQPAMSPEIQQRHEDSKRRYPNLNLSPGEFIISDVKRHPFGLIRIWAGVALVIAAIFITVPLITSSANELEAGLVSTSSSLLLYVMAIILSGFALVGGLIAAYVYNSNQFFLTNESVIQEIQVGLFSRREQTVSLANIEDASYTQDGIFPHMLNYGSIRLSTEGDETTYRFSLVSNPRRQIALLNNAVEAFKNGRPVVYEDIGS